ncbi:MAG: hypothetical protein ACK5D5_11780 [Bacteroidota bacterium]
MNLSVFFKNVKDNFTLWYNIFTHFLGSDLGFRFFPFRKNYHAIAVLLFTSIAIYVNTLSHETAYDDEQVIRKNDFVLRGVSGIPDIITKDSHFSYYKNSGIDNILPGGRYRPLSIVSFALEQELVGTWHTKVPRQFIWDVNGNGNADPDEDRIDDRVLNDEDFFIRGTGLRHFNNIMLYAIMICLLYLLFIKYIKILNPDLIFLALLLFSVHPIHTEVVANIKGRDELFSMFFIALSLILFFRFLK